MNDVGHTGRPKQYASQERGDIPGRLGHDRLLSRHRPQVAGSDAHRSMNHVWLPDHRAGVDPMGAAVTDASQTLTNQQLLERVRSAARHLKDLGVRHQGVVGLALTNRVEYVVLLFATWRLGAAVAVIDPTSADAEANWRLDASDGCLLVAENRARTLGTATTLAVGDLEHRLGWPDLMATPDPLAPALIMYDGHTTGAFASLFLDHSEVDVMARSMIDALILGPGDRCVLAHPLSDAFGVVGGLLVPLVAGASLVLDPQRCQPQWRRAGSAKQGRPVSNETPR